MILKCRREAWVGLMFTKTLNENSSSRKQRDTTWRCQIKLFNAFFIFFIFHINDQHFAYIHSTYQWKSDLWYKKTFVLALYILYQIIRRKFRGMKQKIFDVSRVRLAVEKAAQVFLCCTSATVTLARTFATRHFIEGGLSCARQLTVVPFYCVPFGRSIFPNMAVG